MRWPRPYLVAPPSGCNLLSDVASLLQYGSAPGRWFHPQDMAPPLGSDSSLDWPHPWEVAPSPGCGCTPWRWLSLCTWLCTLAYASSSNLVRLPEPVWEGPAAHVMCGSCAGQGHGRWSPFLSCCTRDCPWSVECPFRVGCWTLNSVVNLYSPLWVVTIPQTLWGPLGFQL